MVVVHLAEQFEHALRRPILCVYAQLQHEIQSLVIKLVHLLVTVQTDNILVQFVLLSDAKVNKRCA